MRSDFRSSSDSINISPPERFKGPAELVTEGATYGEARPHSPASALKQLLEGNARWADGKSIHPGSDVARREWVANEGQKPFAAVLSCADSRVPPELLFDQGVGDLFVVRVAGNSIDTLGAQSLEYAAAHLGVETILVLGHQNCGAVNGAVHLYPAGAPEFLSTVYAAIAGAEEVIAKQGGNSKDKEALGKSPSISTSLEWSINYSQPIPSSK